MSERTSTSGRFDGAEAVTSTIGTEALHLSPTDESHAITIVIAGESPAVEYEAMCLCGFTSDYVPDRRRAAQAGRHHIEAEQPIGYLPAEVINADPSRGVVLSSDPDPWMTPCPDWCVDSGQHRMVTSHMEDRNHVSEDAEVVLRHVRAKYDGPSAAFYLAHAEIYLRQNALAIEPTVRVGLVAWAGQQEVDLALDEAEAIGRTLLALVEAAR